MVMNWLLGSVLILTLISFFGLVAVFVVIIRSWQVIFETLGDAGRS